MAAVLSRDPERSGRAAQDLGIAPERAYDDHARLIAGEAARGDGIDALAVMTPNHLHYPAARDALAAGLDVICDKPLATRLADRSTWSGGCGRAGSCSASPTTTPAIRWSGRPARWCRSGELGAIRQVQVEYIQGHLAAPTAADRDPAANWRFSGEQGGPSLVLGDIGTHAHHLAAFVTGEELAQVAAEVGSAVPGRQVDDYAHLLLRFGGGARGSMWVTNSAAGAEHGLRIRVFGDRGGLEWQQEDPNHLLHRPLDGFARVLTRGRPG